jgi:hypothetical protein
VGKSDRAESSVALMAQMGRPPKPNEQKRLLGNPGRRELPDEMQIELLPAAENTPEPSRPLMKYGREVWDNVWNAGGLWLSPTTDSELLLMTCELIDERWNLRIKVMQTDDARMRRGLRDIDRLIVGNLSLLGFTPADRSRLGVAEVKAKSKLEELLAKKAARG